jgi:pyruvate dehydrogenase E2 component (dihydrolipoamide acetyltransferase)
MAYSVIMPKAGMMMETGRVMRWFKKEGEQVDAGEPLLEIETDKTTMEIEAGESGVLLKIRACAGTVVPVTQTIGYIGKFGEPLPKDEPIRIITEKQTSSNAWKRTKAALRTDSGVLATPAARALARQKGVPLSSVQPSGSFGQIKAADVAAHGGNKLVPHSAMRRTIAQRMQQSRDIPAVTQHSIADVTEMTAIRSKLNAKSDGAHLTVNDFVVKAAAIALKEQPLINVSFSPEGIFIKDHVHIGIAVTREDGLIVPVLRDADTLPIWQISQKAKALAEKARAGRLLPDEYTGGTFTVSNLGAYGVTMFTPMINPPESAILGVCAIEQRLEMDDAGHIEKRLKMGLSLTYDHRSIDGAQAAIFTARIIELLQAPEKLVKN